MAVVLMKKVTAQVSGGDEEVVIGASQRVIEAVLYDFDGAVQNVTGWSAKIVGTSDDLPGVSIDVAGEIVSPASGGTFRWTGVGDFLTQIGEKSRARFNCQVKWTDSGGLVDYSSVFTLTFVVDATGEDTNMNAAAVQALIDASVHKKLMSGKWLTLMHTGATSSSVPGIRSSGYEERLWRGAAEIRLPSGGNKAFTSALFNSVDDGAFPQPGLAQNVLWNTAWEWRMAMNCMTMLPAAGQCYQGIMVGGPIFTTTPWDGNETAMYVSGAQPFVQLRNNLTRGKWELVVWSQVDESGENVVPMEVTDCTYNPTFLPDQFITEATLRYDPAPNGGNVLRAYLNKQLAATVSSPALQLFRGGSVTCRAGFFATSGTTGAAVTDAIFYEGHWWSDTRSEWSAE